jgi:hypothetical protein
MLLEQFGKRPFSRFLAALTVEKNSDDCAAALERPAR